MNISPIDEQLSYITVRIEADLDPISDEEEGERFRVGTGFNFMYTLEGKNVSVIVTNRHMIRQFDKEGNDRGPVNSGVIYLHAADEQTNPLRKPLEVVIEKGFSELWIPHPDPEIDLCICPLKWLSAIFEELDQSVYSFGIGYDYSSFPPDQLKPLSDILVVGYPNGIWDEVNNLPVVVQGITATPPYIKYQGKDQFLISAAVYPGSSGSPVLLYERTTTVFMNQSLNLPKAVIELGGYKYDALRHTHGSNTYLIGIVSAEHIYEAEGRVVRKANLSELFLNHAAFVAPVPMGLSIVIPAEKLRDFEPKLLEIGPEKLQVPTSEELKRG